MGRRLKNCPVAVPGRCARRRSAGGLSAPCALLCALLCALGCLLAAPAEARAPHRPALAGRQVYRFATSTSALQVQWRGAGHGVGMSQYGALGAANAGVGPVHLLHFYYPNTRLLTEPVQSIRVKISEATADTTIYGSAPNLEIAGVGPVAPGYAYYRLVPDGSGLALQGQLSGSVIWQALRSGLPSSVQFFTSRHFLRLLLADGTSARYRGELGAVRSGAGEITVNEVALDHYVAGVAAREVSSSWPLAARSAQAIAARSYALANKAADQPGDPYDICDTSSCQVYGGMAHLDSSGSVDWRADEDAAAATRYQALTYHGAPIYAEYSASNGGATVDAGQPYFAAQVDPYDTWNLAHDPYLDQSRTVSASQFASAFGMASVSSVTVQSRDGVGPWGGRVMQASVSGRTSGGASRTVTTDGFGLGDAAGVWTDYVRFSP